jgi:hypothetical protein
MGQSDCRSLTSSDASGQESECTRRIGDSGPAVVDGLYLCDSWRFRRQHHASCGYAEFCYYNDLKTPIVNPERLPNALSRMTVGTLDDLGYEVDYAGADDFNTDF